MGRKKGSKNKPKGGKIFQVDERDVGITGISLPPPLTGVKRYIACDVCDTPILTEFPLHKVGDECVVDVVCTKKGCGFFIKMRGAVKVVIKDYNS